MLGKSAISWKSMRFRNSYPSSTELELAALYIATSEAIWLRKILDSIGYPQTTTAINEDKHGAI